MRNAITWQFMQTKRKKSLNYSVTTATLTLSAFVCSRLFTRWQMNMWKLKTKNEREKEKRSKLYKSRAVELFVHSHLLAFVFFFHLFSFLSFRMAQFDGQHSFGCACSEKVCESLMVHFAFDIARNRKKKWKWFPDWKEIFLNYILFATNSNWFNPIEIEYYSWWFMSIREFLESSKSIWKKKKKYE